MDIRSGNIDDNIDSIKKHILESDFISIDINVTSYVDKIEDESFDSIQEKYNALKDKYSSYSITQIGICPFKFEDSGYIAMPYNISAYQSQQYYDRPFLLDSDLLENKRKENFDINEWIDSSLTFIPKSELEERLKKISEDKQRKQTNTLTLTIEEKETMSTIFNLIDKWLENSSISYTDEGEVDPIPFTDDIGHEIFSTSNDDFHLQTSQLTQNSNELIIPEDILKPTIRLQSIHQEINKKYPELLTEYSQKDQKFIIKRLDYVENQIKTQQEVNRIINFLIESNKPIVGYNLMFQLMLLYQHFIGELPDDYNNFKEDIHSTFPKLIDTRYIEIRSQQSRKYNFESNNNFDDLLKAILTSTENQKVDISLYDQFQRYDLNSYYNKIEEGNNNKNPSYFNEAGFKALINGTCFTTFGLLAEKSNRNSNMDHAPHFTLLKQSNYIFYFDWEFKLNGTSRSMSSVSTKKRKRKVISREEDNELIASILQNHEPISNRTRASVTPASKKYTRETITTSKKQKRGTKEKKESAPVEQLEFNMSELDDLKTPQKSVRKKRSQTTNKKVTNKRRVRNVTDEETLKEDLTTPKIIEEEDKNIKNSNEISQNKSVEASTLEPIKEEQNEESTENDSMEVEKGEPPKQLKDYPECTIS